MLDGEAEALGVAPVPAGWHELRGAHGQDRAQQLGHRGGHVRIRRGEVAQQLDAEPDVALLVVGDVPHARAEGGQHPAPREVPLDHLLAGLGERRLDDQVVERHGLRELRRRAVPPQLARVLVEQLEGPQEAPGQLGADGRQPAAHRAVPEAGDLVHEAPEEDGVARLVGLLRGQEVLLLLRRRGVDERRQRVRHRVVAPEEEE
ncbi:MAG TPA: hypothetical protein VN213_14840 [Solirubrobacteraceae bacterium]|nr:hypothetical protein [Solirubrobacteraceae bacterium]